MGSSMRLYIKNAIFSSLMIQNLINDLLDVAKINNSAFVINNSYFNLIETIQEAFGIIQFHAEQKNIVLSLEFDESTPFILRKVYSDKRRFL